MGGGGVGLVSGGGSRGASLGGLGMRAMSSLVLIDVVPALFSASPGGTI
jgi:hypothetical protein